MRKTALIITLTLGLMAAFSCSNWTRYTPGNLDNRAIQAEVEKNLAGDGLTGVVHVDSVSGDGTLSSIGSSPFADNQTAPCWVEITHDGQFLFTVNTASGSISPRMLCMARMWAHVFHDSK